MNHKIKSNKNIKPTKHKNVNKHAQHIQVDTFQQNKSYNIFN